VVINDIIDFSCASLLAGGCDLQETVRSRLTLSAGRPVRVPGTWKLSLAIRHPGDVLKDKMVQEGLGAPIRLNKRPAVLVRHPDVLEDHLPFFTRGPEGIHHALRLVFPPDAGEQ
jgi:hypothetical protein